ncbi:Serine/threonine-protein kinase PLK4 [Paramicrosporidium saccamoebae]|uniref:Serine/threonine-protein kinase PLK4 n=1 Tax=Paramicrosporidium saccamoebae TaxID=1246581 RepID=A0A2H9TGP8_9FUNG|nr:Serine/threonine-protein kinase PLK4 [Paramicrosporidium saccamoebae]
MLLTTLGFILVVSIYGGGYASKLSLINLSNVPTEKQTERTVSSGNLTTLLSNQDALDNEAKNDSVSTKPAISTSIEATSDKAELAEPPEMTIAEALQALTTEELLSLTGTPGKPNQPAYTSWKGQMCDKDRFKRLGRAGSGTSAVYRALDKDETVVAIKYVDKSKIQEIQTEMVFLSRLHHSAIANLHCVYPHSNYIALVMPFIDGVTLAATIKQEIDDDLRKSIMRQLVDVLGYLHSQNIWHRDIKLENLMLSKDNVLYLIDFGFATINGQRKDRVGSPFYISPEVWDGAPSAEASDWFAVGIIFFELLNRYHPFNHLRYSSDVHHDLAEAFKEGIPETGDTHENELIQHLTVPNVEKRWGYLQLEQIRNHKSIKA